MTTETNVDERYNEKEVSGIAKVQTRDDGWRSVPERPLGSESEGGVRGEGGFWWGWFDAFRNIGHVYLATHIGFFLLTYLASLFLIENDSPKAFGWSALVGFWNRWDTNQFTTIAMHGYDAAWRTAFFPLYPYMERGVAFFTHNPFVAGLMIANGATLILFMVFYRLVKEDFGVDVARRSLLYLAVFPTAFFLVAAYNESLFLCLMMLSFYCMRRGKWWYAGVVGFLAALTRSSGLLLLFPYVYEYLRQRNFQVKRVRFDVVSVLLVPAGTGGFAVYCFYRFHDVLAFSHAQAAWHRALAFPWITFLRAWWVLMHTKPVSFSFIHTLLDFAAGVFVLGLVVLCFVGPWRLRGERRVYGLYAAVLYLFLMLFPSPLSPVQSLSRLVIEVFPAFIVLGMMGRGETFRFYYFVVMGALACFMTLQFLTGYWIV